ncbi:4-hydroxy-tetrahydrodipicolinate synthase [Lutibacter sp.]
MKKLLGTGVALVTPFNSDKSIDFEALERLVNYQITQGVDYLVVLGTTGEPATLTLEEKEQVKQTIVSVTAKRVPLVLGIGGNNTAAVVEEIKSTDLSNFSAILSVAPYYNKPTQEGFYQHFKAIALASDVPVIIYNVPSRTGKNVEPNTIVRLASDFENIIGVKEAAGDIEQAMRLLKDVPNDFLVISGDDMIALPMTLLGGAGVISVIGQAFPESFSKMIRLAMQGDNKAAYTQFYKFIDGVDFIFEEGNPAGIKTMLEALKICSPYVRLPLVEASSVLKKKISNFVANYQS